MRKKLLWLAAVITGAVVASNLVDRQRNKRRRELWAEATRQP